MASGVDAVTGASGAAANAPAANNASPLAQKDAFLKLLVAQIRNQNPLNPADGIQFVSQLAQFTELEQIMSIRTDLEAVRQAIGTGAAPQGDGAAEKTGA